jgi:predicted ester cyclase
MLVEENKALVRREQAELWNHTGTLDAAVAERDKVVAHWRAHATHQGEYMGIPPTGNRVNFRGISIYRIEGAQIAESWGLSDDLGLMRQIGAIPEPGQEAGG